MQHRKGSFELFTTASTENKLSPIPKEKAESLFYFLSDSAEAYLENEGQTQAAKLDSKTLKELQGLGYTQ
ncbi:MAG: hypothetical protein L3J22_02015 [Xanthomonadales bacterium]|nr:hypothetical protein [Xanthomonadales bacterium]